MKTKTFAYVTALTALSVAGAHAQAMTDGYNTGYDTSVEANTTTNTETTDGTTTTVTTEYVSSTTVAPAVFGDAPATPTLTAASNVQVKMPDGKVLTIADSSDAPWNKDAQLQGYDRFTFDPVNNLFVAGKGDAKFENNWDENGNRIQKVAPAPKKKKKVTAPVEEPVAETPAAETPVEETPAVETPASEAPAETPAVETPALETAPAVSPTGAL